jgi:hypothetical protein
MCATHSFLGPGPRAHPGGATATITGSKRADAPRCRWRPKIPPAFPPCAVEATHAIALLDVVDVLRAIQQASGAMASPGGSALDLRALQCWLRKRFGARRFICIASGDPIMPVGGISRAVAVGLGWEWVIPHRRTWGRDVPPTAAFICATLECLRFELDASSLHTVIVIGHRDIFAEPIARFARAGGHAAGVGLIERLGDALIELMDEPRCQLLDLEFDARAARLPDRLLFKGPDPSVAAVRGDPAGGSFRCRFRVEPMRSRAS